MVNLGEVAIHYHKNVEGEKTARKEVICKREPFLTEATDNGERVKCSREE